MDTQHARADEPEPGATGSPRMGPRPLQLYLRLLTAMTPEMRVRGARSGAGIGNAALLLEAAFGAPADPERFLRGLRAYWRHPYRRRLPDPSVVWRSGSARLLDYGHGSTGLPILALPSLVNRAYILV